MEAMTMIRMKEKSFTLQPSYSMCQFTSLFPDNAEMNSWSVGSLPTHYTPIVAYPYHICCFHTWSWRNHPPPIQSPKCYVHSNRGWDLKTTKNETHSSVLIMPKSVSTTGMKKFSSTTNYSRTSLQWTPRDQILVLISEVSLFQEENKYVFIRLKGWDLVKRPDYLGFHISGVYF